VDIPDIGTYVANYKLGELGHVTLFFFLSLSFLFGNRKNSTNQVEILLQEFAS
jgi:hypothetical protein